MNVRLLLQQGKKGSRPIPIKGPEVTVGRQNSCGVRIISKEVSRQHCQIRMQGNRVSVRDLGSVNGTYVNGRLITGEQLLNQGDKLQLGSITFIVDCGQGAARPMVEAEALPAAEVLEAFVEGAGEGAAEALTEAQPRAKKSKKEPPKKAPPAPAPRTPAPRAPAPPPGDLPMAEVEEELPMAEVEEELPMVVEEEELPMAVEEEELPMAVEEDLPAAEVEEEFAFGAEEEPAEAEEEEDAPWWGGNDDE